MITWTRLGSAYTPSPGRPRLRCHKTTKRIATETRRARTTHTIGLDGGRGAGGWRRAGPRARAGGRDGRGRMDEGGPLPPTFAFPVGDGEVQGVGPGRPRRREDRGLLIYGAVHTPLVG